MRMISPSSRLPFRTIVVFGAVIAALCAGGPGVTARAPKAASHERGVSTADHAVTPDHAASAQVRERYGNLPLSFEANHGQSDSTVKFLSRGSGYSLFLTSTEAVLVLSQSEADESRTASRVARTAVRARHRKSAVVRMTLVNANPHAQATGRDELPGKSNYFIGNDPAKWRTNIPTYAKVKYEGVYPGVDLVYYDTQGQLEYDFVVAPGADPRLVTLAFEGAREVHIDARGELVLDVEGSEVRQHKPVVYQEVAGVRQAVAGRYVMKGTRQVGFRVATYDPSRPLIIDPVLVYSTYLGGSGFDLSYRIAVDGAGSAYVTGETASTDFPTTAGAAQTTYAGGTWDVFVTKLDATGSARLYSTYLGGSFSDTGAGIAVDAAGSAYVTGNTGSTDFPTTAGALQATHAGGFQDAFVTKLDATGSGLVYSTYLGGSSADFGRRGIAVDGTGSAYVTGETHSIDFPTTAGAVQPTNAGEFDAFVTKLDATGSGLVYSTYLGGSSPELPDDIAVDGAGSAYVTGFTESTDFPTTAGAAQTTSAGGREAFVTKLDATGSARLYSTYLGGSSDDDGFAIAVDATGGAYVSGTTTSTDFPTTAGAVQPTNAGEFDAFVTKLNATGSGLVYSTYLGGTSLDYGYGIAVDGAGSAYVTGLTSSTNFPTTSDAIQTTNAGFNDAFVTRLNAAGSGLIYSTYLGGSGGEGGVGIALGAGSVYLTGHASSTNFPTTPGAAQTTFAGGTVDGFVAKIEFVVPLPTSADQCKNGGWKTFGVFKNQGDCVSFIASKGKNPPSGL